MGGFSDFARHLALDHDKIINVVSPEVRNHLSLAFPGSDAIITRPDEDAKENSKSFENFEQVQIETEPVDDKEDEEDEEALHLNTSYDMGKKDDSENLITN